MGNKNSTIHDFDFSMICSFFKSLPRQGPGSPEATRLAASFIPPMAADAAIADLGCGTGGQTMTLARSVDGRITGIDLFPDFIDILNDNAAREGLSDRVKGIPGSMDELPFGEGELDLIWSEGAIYNIGFENGLRLWSRYLKTGGYVAVTEATWFTTRRPAEIEEFWMEAYPGIDTAGNLVEAMQRAGYLPVAHFVLPEECWTENYYRHHDRAVEKFLQRFPDNVAAREFVESQRHERRLYEKYKEHYGYVFYIGRKE